MIQLKNVSFTYSRGETKNAISDINLSINTGEVVLLCGESGCGKTTLTRLINGLIPNYYGGDLNGQVLIDDAEVDTIPLYETGKIVGSVFQNPRSQFFNVDTTSELAFGCENKGIEEEDINRRINETVGEFRIENLMDRSIFQLSGGEKQKIACASISACRPEIFVLDEPSSNLDMAAVEDLRHMIALWKAKGKTLIIAEHRLHYLRELTDRVIYMKNGRIEKEYSADEFRQMDREEFGSLGLRPLYLDSLKMEREILPAKKKTLRLSGFLFSYRGNNNAINIDEISLQKGCVAAIIGPNGAGKTTLARCLCGLNRKCRGELHDGNGKHKGKNLLKCCYMVMQDVNHQLFTESVLDEVLLSMEDKDPEKAEKLLSDLDLLSMKDDHPMSLSGGQKQRVAIAGAVASEKEIIIFDEPTSGLDLRHMHEVATIMRKLQEAGKTLIIISHDLGFIMESCTHILQMKDGRIVDSYNLDKEGEEKLKKSFLNNPKDQSESLQSA